MAWKSEESTNVPLREDQLGSSNSKLHCFNYVVMIRHVAPSEDGEGANKKISLD